MKINPISLSVLCLSFITHFAFGQWTILPSGTTADLLAIDFNDDQHGVAVGRNGTILLTNDGGSSWTPANTGTIKEDFRSVVMLHPDTILVAGGTIFAGQLYRTVDGGQNWEALIDISELASSQLGVLSLNYESVYYSADQGTTWDTTSLDLGGTVLMENLHFTDPDTGYITGNVSGFATYSAYGFRTEDGGQNWAPWYVFDFPNDNAWTNFSAPHPDTTYLFTNRFVNFLPSTDNQLIRMTDWYFDTFQGLNSWRFTAEEVNTDMPGTIISSLFPNIQNGFAGSMEGDIFQTWDGGQEWTLVFDGDTSIFEIMAVGPELLYAVGGNGLILKNDFSTGTSDKGPKPQKLTLFPNPARDQLYLKDFPGAAAGATLRAINGQLIRSFTWSGGESIPVKDLSPGIYLLELQSGGTLFRGKFCKQ